MAEQFINVNQEKDTINRYITDINRCTDRLEQVRLGSAMYKRVIRMNVIAVITTVFAVACLIVSKMHNTAAFWFTIAIGALILLFTFSFRKNDDSGDFLLFCIINAVVLILAIVFFLVKFNYFPVIAILVNLVYTILMNFRAKSAAWKIAQDL